jgi:cob(I)alamin adenosyltransferase
MKTDINLNSDSAKAEVHVRLEKAELDLKTAKAKIFSEAMSLSINLDKVAEEFTPEQLKKIKGVLENMYYEIGKIKGWSS